MVSLISEACMIRQLYLFSVLLIDLLCNNDFFPQLPSGMGLFNFRAFVAHNLVLHNQDAKPSCLPAERVPSLLLIRMFMKL